MGIPLGRPPADTPNRISDRELLRHFALDPTSVYQPLK